MLFRYINASLAGQIDEAVGAFRWMSPQRLRFSKPDNYSDVFDRSLKRRRRKAISFV